MSGVSDFLLRSAVFLLSLSGFLIVLIFLFHVIWAVGSDLRDWWRTK